VADKNFTVKHEDRETIVIIPDTGDAQEMQYLEEAEREKTLNQLKRKAPREKSNISHEDRAEAIKEWRDHLERKKKGTRRFF